MQIPRRRAQMLQTYADQDEAHILTPGGLRRLQDDLVSLETLQQPQAIKDVSQAHQKGDLSENAEYKEARARLSGIQARIFSIKEKLKRVVVIESGRNVAGTVQLGSNVVVDVAGSRKTYAIVGPTESNPSRGRISHLSPLGSALVSHAAGEQVEFETPNGMVTYTIIDVT